jgi:hypothetical protein
MRAVTNRVRHVKKHEKNPDYKAFRHLYKHLSYNSLHYDLKKKVGDPRSKYYRHTYFVVDMDDDLRMEDNTEILNENNELVELHAVNVENDLQSFERTSCGMFPDPSIFAAFKQ